jgi:hypothetical protein
VDVERILPEDQSWAFLSDNIHLNNSGSKAVGQIVAREIAKLLGMQINVAPVDTGVVRIDDLLAQCRGKVGAPRRSLIKRLVGTPGRYPSFSPDGRWLLFHNWKAGHNRIKIYDLHQAKLIELSPSENQIGERHPRSSRYGKTNLRSYLARGSMDRPTRLNALWYVTGRP